jgi:8-oxo-dGTP pyrophosphatase MutT (NUDIX family)
MPFARKSWRGLTFAQGKCKVQEMIGVALAGEKDFEIIMEGFFSQEDLAISYQAGGGVLSDGRVRAFVEDRWAEKVAEYEGKGKRVFDGKLFRLNRFARKAGMMVLELGDTSYKEYVGTSTRGFYSLHPEHGLANPLAVSIVLTTSDKKLLLERRSNVDALRGRYHVIGGFLERHMDVGAHGVPDPFGAMKREVLEEIGVGLKDENLICTGLVRNLVIRHPEVCFRAAIDQTFDEVVKISTTSHLDGEIDELLGIDDTAEAVARFIALHQEDIVATGKACLLLYGKYRYGNSWFEDMVRVR